MLQGDSISISSQQIASRLTTASSPNKVKLIDRLKKDMNKKSTRQKVVRYGFIATNVAILLMVAAFVLLKPDSNDLTSTSLLKSATTTEATSNPLDQVSSADIALTVARMSSLPESTAINNQAQSQAIKAASAIASASIITKPQVVTAGLKSKDDIIRYQVKDGDTVITLAQKFGVTSSSIRWSNNLQSDTLTAGAWLYVPPVNGFVYRVQVGDTVASLAERFNASKDKITVFNDAELKGLRVGSLIMIPDGSKANPVTAQQVAQSAGATALPWGGSPIYGYNGYDYGYCTWYVANRIKVPANWGDAHTWDDGAAASGWRVGSSPRVGAIAESEGGYYGHVAYVEAVSPDGSMVKYSDMNGIAGFGRVGYSGWVPASHFSHYISR